MESINNHSVFRYVIPFKIKDDFNKVCHSIDDFNDNLNPKYISINNFKYKWVLDNKDNKSSSLTSESDLYSYIRNEFNSDEIDLVDNKLGLSWLLESDNNHLFTKFRIYETIKDGKDCNWKDFTLSKIGLYLFRNSIGFLWYEINAKFNNFTELEVFQNNFKELNHSKQVFAFTKEEGSFYIKIKREKSLPYGAIDYIFPISFGDWMNDILKKSLDSDVIYFSSRKSSYEEFLKDSAFIKDFRKEGLYFGMSGDYALLMSKLKTSDKEVGDVADKAILYSYMTVNGSDKDTRINTEKRSMSYHLTNGYKESYLYSNEIGKKMLKPFNNVLWFATKEGCSICAWPYKATEKDKEKDNVDFFNGNFKTTVCTDYFHLFIRCLYQSYTLLSFSERIQHNISGSRSSYEDEYKNDDVNKIKQNRNEIEKLVLDINIFLTKNITTSVCHISHQNDFYNYLVRQLQINEESQYVIKGLDALNELVAKQNENDLKKLQEKEQELKELKQKEEDAKSARIQSVLGLVAIFESFSLLVDWNEVEGLGISYILTDPVAFIITLLIIGVTIYTIKTIIDAFKK